MACASFGFILWGLLWLEVDIGPAQAAALLVACLTFGAAWRWLPELTGHLQWDGAGWQWLADNAGQPRAVQELQVLLDLQVLLLLQGRCLLADGRPRRLSLVLSQRAEPARWSQICATLRATLARPGVALGSDGG